MKKYLMMAAAAASLSLPAVAQDAAEKPSYPSPNEIVDKAGAGDWVRIEHDDLLVMDLAADRDGKPRQVVIQLMPAPFSQGWVNNIRKLARANWYDGTAIVRVQDNYVTQWGDPDGEVEGKAKKLPEGLEVMGEVDYLTTFQPGLFDHSWHYWGRSKAIFIEVPAPSSSADVETRLKANFGDAFGDAVGFFAGLPIAITYKREVKYRVGRVSTPDQIWPVHCYGMVGVGRGYSPDTGTGAELYTVIGHAPRHLDRNIALVGRIIEGMEHMSSLPRGTGPLGIYETPEERTAIQSVRLMSDMVDGKALPEYEYLSTKSDAFAKYADARANRRDPFFIVPAGGADICNIPVPVRRVKGG